MLEALDLERTLAKEAYVAAARPLQERLRALQYDLQAAEIPTVVLFEGIDAAGKGTTIARLVERLDPRLFTVVPPRPPTEDEERRHFLWRWQMALPADGRMAILDRSWYGRVLVERLDRDPGDDEVRRSFQAIREFERWLADDGQVLVKFWLHIDRKTQRRRLRAAEKDPLTAWRVSKEDWRHHRQYDRWIRAAEEMFEATDAPHAPWTLVPATDRRVCRLEVLRRLVDAMEEALERRLARPARVSRTALARERTSSRRRARAAEGAMRAREAARAAGLPVEEGGGPPAPPLRRRGTKGARRRAKPSASRRRKG